MEQLQLPEPVHDLIAGDELLPVDIGRSTASTMRVTGPVGDRFLKVQPHDALGTSLLDEADRMRWLCAHVDVPEVVAAGTDGELEWLLVSSIAGADATHPENQHDQEQLVRILGEGLRTFHDSAPVDECPFDARTATALEQARERVEGGRVDAGDFGVLFRGLTAEQAFDLLTDCGRPPDDDLVVLHGDYCVPNVIIAGGSITGYVDLGRAGVGDRHRDLGIACRSIALNFGAPAVSLFVDAYGIDRPDLSRLDYFVMLDEFF